MSLNRESIRSYRRLYKTTYELATRSALDNRVGLMRYLSSRFTNAAEAHRRRFSHLMLALDARERQLLSRTSQARTETGTTCHAKRTNERDVGRAHRAVAAERRKLMRQYERLVSHHIDHANALCDALTHAVDEESVMSLLQALAAGIGNLAYQQTVESSLLALARFSAQREARHETTAEATSERQNRIMQQAVLPYCERLLLVHRTAIGEHNRASALLYLTPWQVTEAIVGTRSGVTAHHLRHGQEHVMVEIDENYNKQIVYICCTRGADMDSGSYTWQQPVERVAICASEEVPKTIFHAEYLMTGTRICDALLHESALHQTRKTVLVGHGVGGAVAVVVGLLLHQRGFSVSNVITLGAPKVLQGTLARYVDAINPIRIVLAGDPLVELPVSGAEGDVFVHIGEILLLSPRPDHVADTETGSRDAAVLEEKAEAATTDESTQEEVSTLLSDWLSEETSGGGGGPVTMKVDAPGEADDEEPDAADSSEHYRVVEENYRQGYLVEHYVKHLADGDVGLTYAEGDEVWDEGDYAAMRASSAREPHVTSRALQDRDLEGPL